MDGLDLNDLFHFKEGEASEAQMEKMESLNIRDQFITTEDECVSAQ